MGFFSRSRSKGHYPNNNHGGGYYKRPYGSGGILGKIFDALTGSRRHSRSFPNQYDEHHSDHHDRYHSDNHDEPHQNYNNGHYRRHKSSWS